MEQLSTIEPILFDYHLRSTEFLAQHSPEPGELDAYQEQQINKFHDGEDVWVVRDVSTDGRMYDLLSSGKRGTIASIEYAPELGAGEYSCVIYSDSEKQAAFAQKMSEVRRWINSRGMSPRDSEAIFLGMALTEIERIIAED